ncbi:serine/threonine protein kinase [Zavarzinella formosa]|uniref:serine/threonine protein kinase n=1 Tax=Zavarzinella formosa TaxID=360055 RepID=UPI0002F0CE3B|nr:serine/threonine-protein kinase [Zavarzinella formosa]
MSLDTNLDPKAGIPQQFGAYDVLAKIAEGGMGAVYKGRHRLTGELVAIKVLPASTAKNPVLIKRFEQEFRAAAAINHPNVVRGIEYCGTGSNPFLVMEFVDGESLGSRIDRDGAMSEELAIRIIAQVCQGLHRAHKQKMIHRDVKPDNIMLTVDGVAKLTDLGLVKDEENEMNLTKTGRGLGTPNFMAPEQFRNAKNVDVRSDIYSLGATLYTMLTGEVPFGRVGPLDCWMRKVRNELTSPRELNPAISERVDWAIRRSMSGDPDKRPGTCKEFVEDLTGVSIRPSQANGEAQPATELWYLVYLDDEGVKHTVKGSVDGIRRALKEGLLGDTSNIRAARSKTSPFVGLHHYPEFRDLIIEPAPLPSPAPTGNSANHQAMRQTVGTSTPTPATASRPDPEAVDYAAKARMAHDPNAPTAAYQSATDSSATRPHLRMGGNRPAPRQQEPPKKGFDWMMWLVVLVVALGTSAAAVVMFGKLKM